MEKIDGRRCLKFTAYIFMPDRKDFEDEAARRYYMTNQPGRVQFFDEKGKKVPGKMTAFVNYGQMIDAVAKRLRSFVKNRTKKK